MPRPSASETLTVFSLYEDEIVQQAVEAFNRMQSDVTVDLYRRHEPEHRRHGADYINALNTELLAGKART
jgi:3-keto-L-gulonate-6-phosphate decarboxylase